VSSQSPQILIALIGIFAALAGTTIGSVTTYFANKNLKKKEWELTLIKETLIERKKLYSDFLAEAYRHTLLTVEKNGVNLNELNILHRYLSNIELVSNEKIITEAKTIVSNVFDDYMEAENNENFAALKDRFIKEVKLELESLKKA
jgi:transcriptional antiterminator Rof (Rho-off)